jgi:hypothetical protein
MHTFSYFIGAKPLQDQLKGENLWGSTSMVVVIVANFAAVTIWFVEKDISAG